MVRFSSFEIVAKSLDALYRIAKIKFAADGSIYVFFPGFARTDGIVCRAVLSGGAGAKTQLNLADTGRVTSHIVKYTHHSDGEAHFSQDGKVRTEVRRKSAPLSQQRGHLFTIQLQDIESFPRLKNPRKAQLTINLPENIRALKITGWRHDFSDLKFPEGIPPTSTPKGIESSDGLTRMGLFVAPPEGAMFDDIVLFLAVEEIPWLNEDKDAQLIFFGGFDDTSVALNHSLDTEFLSFAYPCSDFKKLKERIGSIDFVTHRSIRSG